jgi:ABC-type sugar transport system ATPase subunit
VQGDRRPPCTATSNVDDVSKVSGFTLAGLEARGITKSYGAAPVLRDVDITIAPGEIIALAGENGSGKSTFAKIVSGTVAPSAGTVTVNGLQLPPGNPQQAAKCGVSIVPQEISGIPELSVAENILLPLNHSLLSMRARPRGGAALRPLLDRLGVSVDLDAPFRSLPASKAILVELARALVTNPKLLIIDETTAYLERAAASVLLDVLRGIRDDGVSVMFISHRLPEVQELADRVIVLRDGSLVGELSRAESSPDRIARMMVGRDIEVHKRGQAQTTAAPRLAVDDIQLAPGNEPLSLQVRPGEVVGLTGLVNSGCAALLDHIAGARPLGSGTVRIDGTPVTKPGPRAALAAGIALLPGDRQKQGLLLDSSVSANIMLGAWPLLSWTKPGREATVTRQFIDDFGIRPAAPARPARMFSGGNQQKIMLARAIRRDPSVLLLNEPTRGVDIGARAEVYRVIADSLRKGISVLFYSTDMHEVIELSDRVLVLYDNQLAAELAGDQITEENISRAMGGSQ